MRIITTTLALALCSGAVLAQGVNTSIIKQRAREVSGQKQAPLASDVEAAKARSAATASRAAAAPNGIPPAALQKVTGDIAIIRNRPEATDELKQKLTDNLMMCAVGDRKPSREHVARLAGSVAGALTKKSMPAQQQSTLALAMAYVVNGATASPEATQNAIKSARDILLAASVSQTDINVIAKDMQAILDAVQRK